MRVALCLEYPIKQFGGTEIIVQELLTGLPKEIEIVLVSADSEASLQRSGYAHRIAQHFRWDIEAVSFATSRKLAEDLKNAGVDLAHFHFGGNYGWGNRIFGQCPIVPLQRMGVPCITNNNGVFSIFDGYCGAQRSWFIKLGYFLPAWLSKMHVLTKVKTEIAVSRHDLLALHRYYFPLRSKFRLIYPSRIRESERREELPRTKTILCVGTIGPRKGQIYLMEAFCKVAAQHPEWQLALVGRHGEASMVQRIKELIEQHGLQNRVQLLNNVSDGEVENFLRSAAIFAMPSVAEGLGMSLQEALYSGCACVGSRVGGIPDLIQDGDNGLLVEPANADQLARALTQLMGDNVLRDRLRTRGPKSILEKDMTTERMTSKYAALYQRILSTGSA